MKHIRLAGLCGVALTLLLGAPNTARATVTYQMGASTEIPAAQGKVRLHQTKNGNTEIKLAVKHLAPPGRIVPGSDLFVVWVRGLAPGSAAQNLGALKVDKRLNGKLATTTPLTSFDLFITCEQSPLATIPASPELMPVHYDKQ